MDDQKGAQKLSGNDRDEDELSRKLQDDSVIFDHLKSLSKRVEIFGKVVAILVVALGLYIIGAALVGIWRTIYPYESLARLIFMLIFSGSMIVAGCYCLFLGYRAWSNMSSHIVRRLSLVAAVLFCGVIVFVAGRLGLFSEGLLGANILVLLLLIMGGLSYLVCSKVLLRWLTLSEVLGKNRREKAAKSFFSLLAFFLMAALWSLILALAPKKQGHAHVPEVSLWFWLAIVGSVVFVCLVYKIGIQIALRNSTAEKH